MILAIDVGNNHSVLALFSDEGRMVHHWRFAGLAADGALLLMPHGAHAPYIIHSARAMRLHDGDDDDSCH